MQIDHRCESAEPTTPLTRKSRATQHFENQCAHHRELTTKCWVGSSDLLGREQGMRIEFGDLRRILVVITITDQCRLDSDVNQTWPTAASATMGIKQIVNIDKSLEL